MVREAKNFLEKTDSAESAEGFMTDETKRNERKMGQTWKSPEIYRNRRGGFGGA